MYVDSVVFMYAFGAESPWRDSSSRFLRAAVARELSAVTSVEVLQEILYRYTSIRRFDQLEAAYRGVVVSMRSVLPVTLPDMDEARDLGLALGRDGAISSRDLVHAAVARRHGLSRIVTFDRDFEAVPGITPITPAEALGASGA